MKWYHYIACFFAGVFLANAIPHLVHGISGDAFPTPFADPPGKGLSGPGVNVGWAFFNLVVGYLLFRESRIHYGNRMALVLFFLGALIISLVLSQVFIEKEMI